MQKNWKTPRNYYLLTRFLHLNTSVSKYLAAIFSLSVGFQKASVAKGFWYHFFCSIVSSTPATTAGWPGSLWASTPFIPLPSPYVHTGYRAKRVPGEGGQELVKVRMVPACSTCPCSSNTCLMQCWPTQLLTPGRDKPGLPLPWQTRSSEDPGTPLIVRTHGGYSHQPPKLLSYLSVSVEIFLPKKVFSIDHTQSSGHWSKWKDFQWFQGGLVHALY